MLGNSVHFAIPTPPRSFSTQRLVVRLEKLSDAAVLSQTLTANRAELEPWIRFAPNSLSKQSCAAQIRRHLDEFTSGKSVRMHIFEAGAGSTAGKAGAKAELLGAIGLTNVNWERESGELGYWIVPSRRRQGFALEAVGGMLCWIREHLTLSRVEIRCDEENKASRLLALAAGFTLDSYLHWERISPIDGKFRNVCVYALALQR